MTDKSEDEDPDIFRQNNLATVIPNDKITRSIDKKNSKNEEILNNKDNRWTDPQNITENADIKGENEAKQRVHPSRTEGEIN